MVVAAVARFPRTDASCASSRSIFSAIASARLRTVVEGVVMVKNQLSSTSPVGCIQESGATISLGGLSRSARRSQ